MTAPAFIAATRNFLVELERLQEILLQQPDEAIFQRIRDLQEQFLQQVRAFASTLTNPLADPGIFLIRKQNELIQQHLNNLRERIDLHLTSDITPHKALDVFDHQFRFKKVVQKHLEDLEHVFPACGSPSDQPSAD
ncbi:MAG: hypothetical protein GXO78_07935 [Calditrichaeota bacterium]|nr:hypothetical protein [Calditrichota bacterium]